MNGLQTEKKHVPWQYMCTALVALYLTGASWHGIAGDFAGGRYGSLVTRSALIVIVSLVAGWRGGGFLAREQRLRPDYLLLMACFWAILFYPLVSHSSYLGRSVRQVVRYLERLQQKNHGSMLDVVRAFPGTYEKYWQDNSILPKGFIYLNSMVKVYLLHISPNPTVALGKKGFYFEGYGARKVEKGIVESFDNIADYLGMIPFSPLELWKWNQTLEERSYWLKERGVDYVFVLAPTKGLVYPENLPASLRRRIGGTRRYMQLSRYLRNNTDIHFIDLLPPLLAAKKKSPSPQLFYKTDFHWNFYGSFVAYQAMVRGLQRFFPKYHLRPLSLDDFTIKVNKHWAHHRFMNMIGLPERLHRHEHYLTLVPKPGTPLYGLRDLPADGVHDVYPPKGILTNNKGESMAIRMVHNPRATIDSILLLGDSFMEKCVYYFSAHAKEVWNYRTVVNFPYKIFLYKNPTITIQEILNMFLLRPPPENPPGIRQEYLAAQAARLRASGAVIIPLQTHPVSGGRMVRIPVPAAACKGRRSIVRIGLDGGGSRRIQVSFVMAGTSDEKRWTEERMHGKHTTFYVSLPPDGSVRALLLRYAGKSTAAPSISETVLIAGASAQKEE